jgi:hypothetical protein
MTQTLILLFDMFASPLILLTSLAYAEEWSPDMRLTWNSADDYYPSIAQAREGRIWVVWHSYRTGDCELFYKVYDPSKVHPWSYDTQLTQTPGIDATPSITATRDGRVWVVWKSNRGGNSDIFYKVYNGTLWSPDRQLTFNPSEDEFPAILQLSNGTILVVFDSNRTGDCELFYKMSSDGGATWGPDIQLTKYPAADDWAPSITQALNGKIWVVWVRDDDIFYKVYDGVTWSQDIRLTKSQVSFDWHPKIMQAADGAVWVVWDSDRNGDQDIYYMIYKDNSWSPEMQLTTDAADDFMPSILQASDGTIWVTWTSDRFDNFDIYYKTNSKPEPHDVAIFSLQITAIQDKTVSIEVVPQNLGANPETFNISCYANSTLIFFKQINLSPGQLYSMTFKWNAASVNPATYVISAYASVVQYETNTANNVYIDGMITHNVAITNVCISHTCVYQGNLITINVQVINKGSFRENLTVTTYYNSTAIQTQKVTDLDSNANLTLNFYWNTSGIHYGYYIISATVKPVPGESDFSDNSMSDKTVHVRIPGDINCDGTVDIFDFSMLYSAYGSTPNSPNWNADADINGDKNVDIYDFSILRTNYGKKE